ncbi:MAG TPA: potassium-transporting ATPase subunit C [Gemmataceae bacterium]|jgi:K+-transporting ATPase ATPase C chain|nr:potassium-transporting ATPase subunit C [Gemmataceae bacterium]
MSQHLRANLWLLVLSLVLCCVLYPLVLWAIGQTVFPERANGSMILDKDGKPIGSRLIGQPFTKDEYFQPRPSAAGSGNGYNAAASGASNWGANNMLLRARVAQALGPIVKYRGKSPTGNAVQKDIELWFQQWSKKHPKEEVGIVAKWADTYSSVATAWVKTDKPYGAYVEAWQKAHPDDVKAFVKDHPDNPEPKPEDMASDFFKSYSKEHPGTWPSYAAPEGKTEKVWQNVKEGSDVQSFFFDMWRQEHPDKDLLEDVPADMVMASGSGLDPHITLKNALYQLENRVADAWAAKLNKKSDSEKAEVRQEIEHMLNDRASAPLGGLVGVKLVNVLEVNLALRDRYESQAGATK